MFDERTFIAKLEAAGADELASILMRPSLDEEKALRAHLGDERYQRMHSMALKRKVSRSVTAAPKGNVVVIHGIMGGELKVSSGGDGDLTWVNAFRIFRGWLDRLRLSDDGRTEANPKFKVIASGIMKRYYGEMLLSLSQQWNVKAFWFDWRKDLDLAADELNRQVNSWFDNKAPVHIVAHSMGGLVARTFMKKYDSRWKAMWDRDGKGKAGGRLVMLGTPNQGSFSIPQVITGLEDIVRKLALVDIRHNVHDLLATFNSFVGSYQMLPSPLALPAMMDLYNSGTYSRFNANVPQPHLDNARAHHQWLLDVIDFDRMIYVAGYDQPTFCNVSDWTKLDKTEGYRLTQAGDGRVPHELGLLFSPYKKKQVLTYYIVENHGNLSTNTTILAALDQLLETGATSALPTEIPAIQRGQENQGELKKRYEQARLADEDQLLTSLRRMNTRGLTPNQEDDPFADDQSQMRSAPPILISPEERKVEEAITRGFLASRSDEQPTEGDFDGQRAIEHAKIEIGLVHGGIESVDYESIRTNAKHSVDAIAVGHYIGVQPQFAELALDQAISAALIGKSGNSRTSRSDLILTQYTERGVIQGKLGQPFMMPDPRPPKNRKSGTTGRLIVLAGMDEPGRFGVPELALLARELCWSLGRLNKLHLATVMIGSGDGNLALRDTIAGWLSGIRHAVSGSAFDEGRRLHRITFVEKDPRKVIQLDRLIKQEKARNAANNTGFVIDYNGLSDGELADLKKEAYEAAKRELDRQWVTQEGPQDKDQQPVPSRVTLSLDLAKKTYHYGAITDTAAVPERDIVIDPALVLQANDELAAEQASSMQLERGRFLEKLLIPQDLRKQLYSRAPLVMLLDATTARIHWEMVAQPSLGSSPANAKPAEKGFDYEEDFLGTSRGFTRQLRTTFAPPPEPPPPPQKVLRVLVVADPAADAHLPGAQEEGVMVAELFDSYNVVYQETLSTTRIEVKRLFGPIEATRGNVMRELMERSYDVLHFAGHCVYQWDGDPSLSGWIFNMKNKELLTANELYRIDRIPKFVFSNACESGVTPDRAQDRNDKLAPSFAEAFFARGVANFVCTAWPVDDVAARTFALSLYGGLLGIKLDASGAADQDGKQETLPMHDAMRQARLAIAKTPNGRTTWGAYQHYGNPYFQFFFSKADTESQTKGQFGDSDPIKRQERSMSGSKKRRARPRRRGRK